MVKVVLVAFTIEKENSIGYSKESYDPKSMAEDFPEMVGKTLLDMYLKGADFVSIRFVRKKSN